MSALADAAERRRYALLQAAATLLGSTLIAAASLGPDAIKRMHEGMGITCAVGDAHALLAKIECSELEVKL